MHIAILETGRVNPKIATRFEDYPQMFRTFFAAAGALDFTFSDIAVVDGELPDDPKDYDGYIVTGSASGIYDDAPWIAPLIDFLASVHAAGRPQVGICFGHQAIAKALGGEVGKWHDGWGLGAFNVDLHNQPSWIGDSKSARLLHVHQDQVVKLPKGAVHLGSSNFCRNAMFYKGDNVFCIQGHPEFTCEYVEAVMDGRAELMGEERIAGARTSMKDGHDFMHVADWIVAFFRQHDGARASA